MKEQILNWGQRVEPAVGTRIYQSGQDTYWAEEKFINARRSGIYLGNNEVEVESEDKVDEEADLKQASADLREIASRIHCPNTTGGQVAAGIKAEIEAVADRLSPTNDFREIVKSV